MWTLSCSSSLSDLISTSVLLTRLCFLGVLYSLWLLYSFCLLICRVLWQEGFDEGTPFGSRYLKGSDSPFCLFGESAFVADSFNTKLLLWWRRKALIYNISTIKSLVVILLLHSFSRPVEFYFMVAPRTIYSQILDHLSSVMYDLYLMEWTLSQIIYWLSTVISFVAPLPKHTLYLGHYTD